MPKSYADGSTSSESDSPDVEFEVGADAAAENVMSGTLPGDVTWERDADSVTFVGPLSTLRDALGAVERDDAPIAVTVTLSIAAVLGGVLSESGTPE